MSSSLQRKLSRQGRKGGAAAQTHQLVAMLSALAPELQQVEKQLEGVAELGPSLDGIRAEWAQTLTGLRAEMADLRRKQEGQQLLTLLVLHDIVTGRFEGHPDMTLEEFMGRVNQYTLSPETDA
jgi:hypothetical protein